MTRRVPTDASDMQHLLYDFSLTQPPVVHSTLSEHCDFSTYVSSDTHWHSTIDNDLRVSVRAHIVSPFVLVVAGRGGTQIIAFISQYHHRQQTNAPCVRDIRNANTSREMHRIGEQGVFVLNKHQHTHKGQQLIMQRGSLPDRCARLLRDGAHAIWMHPPLR